MTTASQAPALVIFSRMVSLEGSEARLQMVQHAVVFINYHVNNVVLCQSFSTRKRMGMNSVGLTKDHDQADIAER